MEIDPWAMETRADMGVGAPSSSARSRREHLEFDDLDEVAVNMDFDDVDVAEPAPDAAIAARPKGGGRKNGDGDEMALARKKIDPLEFCVEPMKVPMAFLGRAQGDEGRQDRSSWVDKGLGKVRSICVRALELHGQR